MWLARNKSSKGGRGFGREDLEFKCEKREMAPSPSSLKKYIFQRRTIQILNGYANSTESTYPSKKILVVGTPSPKSSVGEDPFLSIGR